MKPIRVFREEDCAPDCEERATCKTVGVFGHMMCGYCDEHDMPVHHCGCIKAAVE